MLALLCLTVSSAWADNLYLKSDDNFATATLMYDGNKGDNPYYQSEKWNGSSANTARNNVTTITVNASCQNFTGTSLKYLFQNFTNLTIIKDLGNLNTSHVTNMQSMFSLCSNLTSIDLSSWNTGNVTSMMSMFNNCSKLERICVGADWSVAKVTMSTSMFTGCTKLPNWDGTTNKTHANTGAGGYLSFKLTANKGNEGEYWTTYYSNVTNYKASEGTKVFKVALELADAAITMTEITGSIVKSGQGVVLKSTSGCIIMSPSNSGGTGNYSDNSLEGTMTEIATTGENNYYVLSYKAETGAGFYKLSNTSGTIGANKAFLTYTAGAREFFLFDEATGIEDNNRETINNNCYYDLQGRRVSQPAKGLYIVRSAEGRLQVKNGKKYIKK